MIIIWERICYLFIYLLSINSSLHMYGYERLHDDGIFWKKFWKIPWVRSTGINNEISMLLSLFYVISLFI